ncbi:hypothetical protein EBN88_05345 [Streptomyces triticirhizae]|uniref:Uncharacterized protein n=1 Tax=Streptomyces triticirhizae TaxID=2483353 RepID=A0A3M2M4E5_9ACTN|nr:hypothetical protein EBN88_05345 [Streptomyces triticirhizae]
MTSAADGTERSRSSSAAWMTAWAPPMWWAASSSRSRPAGSTSSVTWAYASRDSSRAMRSACRHGAVSS